MLLINTNLPSLNAQRHGARNESALAQSIQRLSSGLRVNSAKDDAAGLAIAERFTTQIRGMNQATRNMNDAISLLQTAEGALASVTDLMQRGRELAVQAANGTNSASDRQSLQTEIAEIVAEVERITSTASFNDQLLFDTGAASGAAPSITFQADKQQILDNLQRGWLQHSEDIIESYFGLTGGGADLTIFLDDTIAGASAFVSGTGSSTLSNLELHIDVQEFIAVGLAYPNDNIDSLIAHEVTHAVMGVSTNFVSLEKWFTEGAAEFIPGGDGRLAGVMDGTLDTQSAAQVVANIDNIRGAFGGSHLDYASGYTATRYLHAQIGGDGVKDMLAFLSADTARTMDDYFATGAIGGIADTDAFVTDFKANGAAFIAGLDLANDDTGGIGGADADGGSRDTTFAGTIPNTDNPATDPLQFFNESFPDLTADVVLETNRTLHFQAGAQAGQTLAVSSRNVSSTTLGLAGVNVATSASAAIGVFSEAIDAVSALRAEFGAAMNRFDSARRSTQISAEAASASRSRIVDADFAAETAALTRSQIVLQASNAMIAQANSLPQMVMTLLQGV
jgi:flagellin